MASYCLWGKERSSPAGRPTRQTSPSLPPKDTDPGARHSFSHTNEPFQGTVGRGHDRALGSVTRRRPDGGRKHAPLGQVLLAAVTKADESIPAPKARGSRTPELFPCKPAFSRGAAKGPSSPSWTPGKPTPDGGGRPCPRCGNLSWLRRQAGRCGPSMQAQARQDTMSAIRPGTARWRSGRRPTESGRSPQTGTEPPRSAAREQHGDRDRASVRGKVVPAWARPRGLSRSSAGTGARSLS
jgi:hypothetical protein